jgi:uncharacterized RDD family membrane protein YckC
MSSDVPSSESHVTQPAPARAGLWRRFGAFVHELLFLVGYLFIVGLVFATLSGESMSAGRPQILTGPIAVLQQLYLFVTIGAYFIFFWTRGRRTLAFKTWQLRLLGADGNAPSMKQAIVRYLATWIGPALAVALFAIGGKSVGGWWILALFANFLWAIVDRDRRFLHDRIAGTRVVFSES